MKALRALRRVVKVAPLARNTTSFWAKKRLTSRIMAVDVLGASSHRKGEQ